MTLEGSMRRDMDLLVEGGDVIGFNISPARSRRSGHQYSIEGGRSLIKMTARRLMQRANGTASVILLRPMIVMAARVMGPGPARLRMVKLAHNLSRPGLTIVPPEEDLEGAPVQPTSRAA